jgi:hypothetical protein
MSRLKKCHVKPYRWHDTVCLPIWREEPRTKFALFSHPTNITWYPVINLWNWLMVGREREEGHRCVSCMCVREYHSFILGSAAMDTYTQEGSGAPRGLLLTWWRFEVAPHPHTYHIVLCVHRAGAICLHIFSHTGVFFRSLKSRGI